MRNFILLSENDKFKLGNTQLLIEIEIRGKKNTLIYKLLNKTKLEKKNKNKRQLRTIFKSRPIM